MPRGFLVKRNKNLSAVSHRWEDNRDWQAQHSHMEGGLAMRCPSIFSFDSPDSGYGSSPVTLAADRLQIPVFHFGKDSTPPASTPSSDETVKMYNFNENSNSFSPMIKIPTTPEVGSTQTRSLPLKKRPILADTWTMAIPKPLKSYKKSRAIRKLDFDNDDKSPILGTFIQERSTVGDIHEIRVMRETASEYGIKPTRGVFVCKLCKEDFQNTLSLAQHKCSRIVHVEFRCPECDKVFNCHANLASHRRWHKPKPASSDRSSATPVPATPEFDARFIPAVPKDDTVGASDISSPRSTPSPEMVTRNKGQFHGCERCGKKFRRPVNLRKHLQHHHGEKDIQACLSDIAR